MKALAAMIGRLQWERGQIDKAIAALEVLVESGPPAKSTRGRKSMGREERAEVSRRMKSYWAERRKARTA